jgi:hypothetical protein
MAARFDLDGVVMRVSSTADNGVVNAATRLVFVQRGTRVIARYSGGSIRRGCLAGRTHGRTLRFDFAQVEASGEIHAGSSRCDLARGEDGLFRIVEHFAWRTRAGRGVNVFEQVLPQ